MTRKALTKAVEIVGSQSALARALGVKQAHIHYWLRHNIVPAQHLVPIERATGGMVTRHELRPDLVDLFAPLAEKPCCHPCPSAATTSTPSPG